MKDPNRPEPPRSRVKTGSKSTLFIVLALIAGLVIIFSLFARHKNTDIIHVFDGYLNSPPTSQSSVTPKLSKDNSKTIDHPLKTKDPLSPAGDLSATPAAHDASSQSVIQPPNKTIPQTQVDIGKNETPISEISSKQQVLGYPYQQLVDELNAFYSHLDQQPYMQDFHLKEPSKKHFSKLLQVLIDNPPAVTRETDDYFTLLKNTAHFFRVLGKDNIFILKGILDREKDSFERILKTFYTLSDHPEYLKKEFSLTIPKENLYDYAGFFLNTIGGRLYLFRRDSASRMTVSYYAVLIIDKANRQGNSRLGIDLRPAINSLIDEMENAGNNLKLKEEYLDTLYDLKEHYGNRG